MIAATRRRLIGAGMGAATLLSGAARAQTPAIRAARALVGYAPGGPTDIVARLYAEALRGHYASQIIVENRPGAGGRLVVEALRTAPPDGSALLVSPGSVLTLQPHVYPALVHYDGLVDLRPIAALATFSTGLAVPAAHPARNYAEFADWLRAQRETPIYGSPAAGSGPHFIGARLGRALGVAMTHVPYRGTAPALQDLVAGRLPMMFAPLGDLVPRHGQDLRILAVSAPRRVARVPEVPTFAEVGLPELTLEDWIGAFLPATAPDALVERLAGAVDLAARDAGLLAGLTRLEMRAEPLGPAELTTRIRQERDRWGSIVREAGVTVEE